jgi:Sulfotransferase domain
MTAINTWRPRDGDGGRRDELRAFVQCDYCLPPRSMPGSATELRRVGWRFDDLERGPHGCPICPPRPPGAGRMRLSPPSESPALPNVIVIGATKAGTTALHDYLDLHPEVAMAVDKELDFFVDPQCGERTHEYASFFDGTSPLRGESSPRYTIDPIVPGVPGRIRALVPDVRLIYLVRDPVARALADYAQYAAIWEPLPIEDAFRDLGDPYNRYTAPGLYARQLESYLEFFPAEQILVVDQADLLAHRRRVLGEVFGFIGAAEDFVSQAFDTLINTTALRRRTTPAWRLLRGSRAVGLLKRLPPRPRELALAAGRRLVSRRRVPAADPSPELLERLRATFAGDAARLREMTGREFASWQV